MATSSSPLVTACWTVKPLNSEIFSSTPIALAKQADRPGHHHPHHRWNAEAKHPFGQMINIVQLRFQLAELRQNGQPAFEHHASGVGQQQLAPVADQQGTVQFIFEVFSILLMVGWVTNNFSAARVKLCWRTTSTK